ncbi:signal peptide peptidase SppA [Coralloluteibacterium stylophorae]|uniref:Signal peptide peptidase SppA n=1 Tax=Coralloluteibacterium stylophorae TaxID=1776034 RepID=A0A8J7VS61_9GAMM|nr:signal peptide peptidase SppA [Coralloluteibacterium stylophorae]MBS7457019.1 signal peptide peptidase SppA [Coralloluteibacterium stylophorae]
MTDSRPGPIRRFFGGIWSVLSFFSLLMLNLVVLMVLAVIVGAFVGSRQAAPLDERTALVIAPEGALVEQFSADAASRALARMSGSEVQEVQLRDLLRAIEAARDDDRIDRIFLRTDRLSSASMAALREVGAALRGFRASGKQVIAYADSLEQTGYYLTAQADTVYMHPMGMLLLEGLARYRLYYREGLQDKLGVDVHLFKVGEYKSAAEPYVLDQASPEAKEADLFWMSDIWNRYLADIAEARGLDPAELQASIDGLPARLRAVGGDTARLALDAGLVDGLKTLDEVREEMIGLGAEDTRNHTFRQVDLGGYLAQLDGDAGLGGGDAVGVVVAQGAISGGEQPPGTIGGDSTSALLRQAREDEDVKAVVLRVDSPGGEVFASEQIRHEVELLKAAGKPVVVSMGGVAASGGYWISMNADRIYADPSTITGSIGIFGLFMTFPDTLERIGARSDGVATTRIAGAFDPTRPMDPMVGEIIQSIIEKGYRDFIGKVAEARDHTVAEVDSIARGRVWSGAQALDRGLVDELGGLESAIAEARSLARLGEGEGRIEYIEKPLTPFQQFLTNLSDNAQVGAVLRATGALDLLGAQAVGEQLRRDFGWLSADRDDPRPFRAVVHCFCTL